MQSINDIYKYSYNDELNKIAQQATGLHVGQSSRSSVTSSSVSGTTPNIRPIRGRVTQPRQIQPSQRNVQQSSARQSATQQSLRPSPRRV